VHSILSKFEVKLLICDDLLKNKTFQTSDIHTLVEFDTLIKQADILLAIGGDGTILSTVRRLGYNQKPIMGIHIGGLGFLSECVESNLDKSLHYLLDGQYTISERMLLEAQV
ncbi:uncharacterized protein METZ01_LOCUS516658, partial [marine metagenome]